MKIEQGIIFYKSDHTKKISNLDLNVDLKIDFMLNPYMWSSLFTGTGIPQFSGCQFQQFLIYRDL